MKNLTLKTLFAVLLTGVSVAALPLSAQADDLTSALISVYDKNPRLQAERARLREIDETYVQARAQGRVTISASGQYARTRAESPASSNPFFDSGDGLEYGAPYSGQVQVIQPLYQGGRVKALKRQAKLGILAARENLRAQENNIFLAAANAYVDVLRDEETARIRRNNVRVLSRQLQASQDRFAVGEGTRTDIAQSRSRLALSESGLAQADAQLLISRAAYERIVGRIPVDLQPVPNFLLPQDLPTAIARARDNNPELIGSYFNEAASTAAIDVAKAAGRPTISLNGNLSSARDQVLGFDRSDQQSITAQIRVPIFSGGLNKSRVRQAKHAKARLAFETRDTELAVDQTVKQIWAQLDAAREVLVATQTQVESADIAFEGVSLEQTVGTRTQLDVLNAEQEVLNARLSVVNAQREVDSATFRLLSTMGVFDAEGIQLPVDGYDPEANLSEVSYDGLSEAVDRYVPEAVQKIGSQLPDVASDMVAGTALVIDASEIDRLVDPLVDASGDILSVTKGVVDSATFQTPDLDPRAEILRAPIETEPVQPPSRAKIILPEE